MGEMIFKGTAEVDGVVKPVTYKLTNTHERTDARSELDRLFSGHRNKSVVLIYNSDMPTSYGTPDEAGRMRALPPGLLTPAGFNPEAKPNPSNIPPREASMPPANAPTGSPAGVAQVSPPLNVDERKELEALRAAKGGAVSAPQAEASIADPAAADVQDAPVGRKGPRP